MSDFWYGEDGLMVDQVSLRQIARQHGTPCYVYSKRMIERAIHTYQDAFMAAGFANRHQLCYAVKANSNLAILQVVNGCGAGFDIVSIGELERVRVSGLM